MSESPFPEAAPDFSDPIGLLRACHDRILSFCDRLEAYAGQEADQADHDLARQVHRYFSTAGRHHHQDEEQDVFPILNRQSIKLAELIHSLRQEHAEMDALWQELEPNLLRPAAIEDRQAFRELAGRFVAACRRHVERENREMLEMARHVINSRQLKEIGQKMAERRGVKVRL